MGINGVSKCFNNSLSTTVKVVQDSSGVAKVAKFAVALFSTVDHFSPGSLGRLPFDSGFDKADKALDLLGIFKATKEISKVKNASCLETAQKVMGLAICALTLGVYLEKMQVVKLMPVIRVVSKIPAGTYLLAVPLSALKMVNLSLSLPNQINEVLTKRDILGNARLLDRTTVSENNRVVFDLDERIAEIKRNEAVLTLTETVAKIAFIALSLSVLAMTSPYMLVGGLAIATLSLGNAFYKKSGEDKIESLEADRRAAQQAAFQPA